MPNNSKPVPGNEGKTTDVGQKQEAPTEVKLGPFTASVYYYNIPGYESGWVWRIRGEGGSKDSFETSAEAKWDLAASLKDMLDPINKWARELRKKYEGKDK